MNSLAKLPDVEVVASRQGYGQTRQPSIAASATVKLKRVLETAGIDPAPFAFPDFQDPDARVPYLAYTQLTAAVAETLGRPTLGLDMAFRARLSDLDVLGEVIRYAKDGLDALQRLRRYHILLSDAGRFRIEERGEEVAVLYECPGIPPELQWHDDDFSLAMMIRAAEELTGDQWIPRSVSFTHAPPSDFSAYATVFGQIPTFGAPITEIVFAREVLTRRFPTPVSRMERIVVDTAEALLHRHPMAPTPERVRAAIVECFPSGSVGLASVADRLMVSVRTLQRDLERDGTTFRALVDEVRATEARRLLVQTDRTQADIAFLLGFSEVSAFVKAFRRWHGTTPSQLRPPSAASR